MTRDSLLTWFVAAVPLVLGCGQFKAAPQVAPDQFPDVLLGIEEGVEATIRAIESGNPKAADAPLHQMPRLIGVAKQLARPVGLTDGQQAALTAGLDELSAVFGELHGPVHQGELPADFDFAPYKERMESAVQSVRGAAPADVVALLREQQDQRELSRLAAGIGPQPQAFSAPTESPEAPPSPQEAATEKPPTKPPRPPAGVSTTVRDVAPLCPSVMLWDDESYELAPERINRVAELLEGVPPDRRWVQLVPTLHARLNEDRTIAEYGTMLDRAADWTDADNFRPATTDLADRLRERFVATIGQAVRRGLNVSILPHLDPAGGPVVEWRNLYDFAPSDVIGVGSYESLLIEPLADAVEAEATSDTRIDFALSGEMGRSLFAHPDDYSKLSGRLRSRFSNRPSPARVRIGVALNWSGLAGGVDAESIDRARLSSALDAFDFLAYSCYAPVGVAPSAGDFVTATDGFLSELAGLAGDADVRGVITLAESGIGGGHPTAEKTAAEPYAGSGKPASDPWKDDELQELRRNYHVALLDYLAGDNKPRIDKAFLWSEGPWDPQGVFDRRFRDEEIAKLIDEHNKR